MTRVAEVAAVPHVDMCRSPRDAKEANIFNTKRSSLLDDASLACPYKAHIDRGKRKSSGHPPASQLAYDTYSLLPSTRMNPYAISFVHCPNSEAGWLGAQAGMVSLLASMADTPGQGTSLGCQEEACV